MSMFIPSTFRCWSPPPLVLRRDLSSLSSSSAPGGNHRIILALYRQLLRWCHETDPSIPLSQFIPPVYMTAPQIDIDRLQAWTEAEKAKVFPPNSILESNQLTCPIHNSIHAKDFFRAVFRLNQDVTNDPTIQKQRVSLAFEAIRSLNELNQALKVLQQNRARHVLRDNVDLRVGQVVKHKVEKWRGVITGWHRIEPKSSSNGGGQGKYDQPTSLTQKSYTLDPVDTIRYTVLLDSGDAHLHYSKRQESGTFNQAEVYQSDLELIDDDSLLRIRSTATANIFSRFDPYNKTFIPNDLVAYEYPKDAEENLPTMSSESSNEAALQVIQGTEEISEHLKRIILDYTSAPETRKLKLLGLFLERMTKLCNGDVLPIKDRFTTVSQTKLAAQYLKHLISLSEDIGDLFWHRRRFMENASHSEFSVGDIVKHKEYGFRGVIVAFDPEPAVDVSRWDGLQHIKNPERYPFYHVIPDQRDCIEAFGSERPTRYVCEANLEMCPYSERNIQVDMDPEWVYDSADGGYVPPDDIKFKFGIDLDDEGLTKQCLTEIRDALTRALVGMRDNTPIGSGTLDTAVAKLSMSNLYTVLKNSEDLDTATTLSDCLKEIWRAHNNGDLKYRLDTAIAALLGGKTEHALTLFTSLIDEDPTYAEAWNKASTCEFMLGNLDASLAAAQKTLELIPNHYQAQNGLGLVYYEKKDYQAAIDSFRKSLELDPWSPVSARLSICVDAVEKWKKSPSPKSLD